VICFAFDLPTPFNHLPGARRGRLIGSMTLYLDNLRLHFAAAVQDCRPHLHLRRL